MGTKIKPVIYKIDDNISSLKKFQDELIMRSSERENVILFEYPTIYIHNWKKADDYEIYVGESNSII